MTAGNQGHAWDNAKKDLKKDPSNKVLQAAEAEAKAVYNRSLTRAGQKPRS